MRTPNGRSFLEPAPMVRVVVVDTGITGTIDPEQADWLEEMLAPSSRTLHPFRRWS